MKYFRIRAYTRATGKYSIWSLALSANDIRRRARQHKDHLTLEPVVTFKCITGVANPGVVSIAKLSNPDDITSITKKIEFRTSFEEDEDGNATVRFESDTPFFAYANDNVEDEDDKLLPVKETKELVYYYRFDQMGYVSGSFYRLFDEILKSGNFSTIDGTKYLSGEEKTPGFTPEDIEKIVARRDGIKAKKIEEYKERDVARLAALEAKKKAEAEDEDE